MPIVGEAKETLQRFSKYIQELVELFKRFDIIGSRAPQNLWKAMGNGEFRREWKRIWSEIAECDGGKLSLTTVLAIIGAVFGGVGIAAFGGAIGVPLALLFAPVGDLLGAEIDSWSLVRRIRKSFAAPEIPQGEPELEEVSAVASPELLSALIAGCEHAGQVAEATAERKTGLEEFGFRTFTRGYGSTVAS
jgi:hypothetical protein